MNLGQIIAQARIELDDTEPDYLWSDAELTFYANEAEEEAARRSRLLIDASTAAICTITLVSGQSEYSLDGRVIGLRSAQPSWRSKALSFETVAAMDEDCPGWQARTGAPQSVVADYETGVLKLCPTPTAADAGETVQLRVTRLPLEPLVDAADTPEIKAVYHRKLIHWIKHKAYLKPDADTLNKDASATALAFFEQEFGPAKSAWSDEFDARNMPYGVDGVY